MKSAPALASTEISERALRDQVERLVSSSTFAPSDRMKRFFTFIAEETIQGRGESLKEYVIGVHVFARDTSFDPRTDPVVRVQARRLRMRIDRYYHEEGRADEIRIDLPKGGYVPTFQRMKVVLPEPVHAPRQASHSTLAVSVVNSHAGDEDLDEFCHGLRESLVGRLMSVRSVQILASETAAAAFELRATLRRATDGLRLTVSLVDAGTACYVLHQSLDVRNTSAFAARDEVTETIANRVRACLPHANEERREPENLAARNLCKQGFYHLEQRTGDGLLRAAELFERAIVEDAYSSVAHSGLSDAYSLLGSCGVKPAHTLTTLALSNAATAVMLDGASVQAVTSLANAKARANWNWLEARDEFQRAIRLDDTYATAHHWYARSCLLPLRRLDEALEQCLIAQSLDPVSPIIGRDVAIIHYFRRDFETALQSCDHTIELNPYFHCAYFVLGLIQQELGEADEAMAAFKRGVELAPTSPQMIAGLGWASAKAGRYDEALTCLGRLDDLARARYVAPLERAILFLGLEDVDRCFDQLAQAFADRYFDTTTIAIDPRFDPIRADARFSVLLAKMGMA